MFNITVFNNETLLKTTLNKSNKIDLGYRTGVFRGGWKINVYRNTVCTVLDNSTFKRGLSGSGFIVKYRYKDIIRIILCDFKLKTKAQ